MQDARVIEVGEMGGETWGMLAVIYLSLLLRLDWQRRSFRLIAAAAFCLRAVVGDARLAGEDACHTAGSEEGPRMLRYAVGAMRSGR